MELTLTRKEHNLTQHLWPFLFSRVNTPFAYGTNDCCMFACDAVLAMTGVDLAVDLRGQYSDGPGALRAVKRIMCSDSVAGAADWVAAKFGIVARGGALWAQRGDLVLAKYSDAEGDTEFLGVVALSGHEIAIPGALGLTHLPLASGVKAWKI